MSKTRRFRPLAQMIVLIGLACFACSPAPDGETPEPVDEAQLHDEIKELVANFMAAYNGEDPEAFVSLFTDDAVRLPPGSETLVGIDRIRDNTVTIFATVDREVTVNVEESKFSGDFAVTRGTWAIRLTPKSGAEGVEDVGKWLNLSVRGNDGKWKIARNIWNSDLPSN